MIQFATQDMIPALKTIWQVCFDEAQPYVDFAFNAIIKPERVLVYRDEMGEPQAMLCIQPAELVSAEGLSCRCAYLYGVATLPRARGRGLSTKLMEAAHKKLGKMGFALSILVPADEGLFTFYGQRGYQTGFFVNKAQIKADEIENTEKNCVLAPSSLERLEEERNTFFGSSSALVKWDQAYLQAIDRECHFLGGEVLRFVCGEEKGYAVCYKLKNKLLVKELAASAGMIETVLCALHSRYRMESYQLNLRPDIHTKFTNAVLPYAMVRWYDKKIETSFERTQGTSGYIAHVLD